MSKYIIQEFSKELKIDITPNKIKSLHQLLVSFEIRDKHPLTLNSQLFGVNPITFNSTDIKEFFDIFGIDRSEMIQLIKNIPSIDTNFKVASDPFNLLVTWLLHISSVNRKLDKRSKDKFQVDLILLWHYKFFTSLITYNFPYGANENIMQTTINNLSNKYDIIRYGSWRDVLLVRSLDLLSRDSIHLNTIYKYDIDKKIIYLITDTQSRIRDKVKKIVSAYHQTKEVGDFISSYKSVGELDSEKVLSNQVSTFDMMINGICLEVNNVYSFVDSKLVELVSSMFKNIRPDMLKYLLIQFSELSAIQTKEGKVNEIVKDKNGEDIYVGSRILISTLIQKSYRFCIKNRVNMSSKLEILNTIKNLYSSSRISDDELVRVKESISHFVVTHGKIKREATICSLRIAFILYILTKTFRYL
jgi:hypothetical protein